MQRMVAVGGILALVRRTSICSVLVRPPRRYCLGELDLLGRKLVLWP